ncbi:MAG: hypothetical protein FRX48_07678 [Lasallia pustulata]|uniref:Uncharacterized protein n=1 Tax=Lasallia pustulata TaxID=136370 RepID=A0A5M8PIB2_9LECA|nr:MAG: hypothetical protein FRX48_07678 [Lasallia pustulata]
MNTCTEQRSKRSSVRLESLAVALIVTKSKPANVSLEDYILKLRRSTTRIQQPQTYVDSIAYWKEAHANSEAAQTALRHRVLELEVQNEHRRRKTRSTTPENASQRKRKRDAIEAVPMRLARAQERARMAQSSTLASKIESKAISTIEELEALTVEELEPLTSAGTANSQIRHLYNLQELMARKTPNHRDLASALVQSISGIGQILWKSKVRNASEPGKATTSTVSNTRGQINKAKQWESKVIEDHDILLKIFFRTFLHILDGLDKLVESAEGATLQGQVIYTIVKLFREALDFIATCDAAIPAAPYTLCPDDFRLRISRVLVMMIASLNSTEVAMNIGARQQIFEGILYVLLERVGRVLRLFTFGSDECDRTASVLGGSSSRNDHDEKLVTAKVSAPSLIWILERAVILFDRNMQHMKRPDELFQGVDAQAMMCKCNRLRTNSKVNLGEGVKRRIQHTLLKGFFDGYDGDFAGALNELKDPQLSLDSEVAVVEEDDVSDWFKHKVERLIGWDTLASCIGWDEESI